MAARVERLAGIVCEHLTVARVAEGLAVPSGTANDAVIAEGKLMLIDDPRRFNRVRVVDEHRSRHTHRGYKYMTAIVDLTPVKDSTQPSKLLEMVEGRSKKALKTPLDARPKALRDAVEVISRDGFTGFKTAAAEKIPDAVAVTDRFRAVQLTGDGLDRCRQRVQQYTCGHRRRSGDPLYGIRWTLHTGDALLTDKQWARAVAIFGDDRHLAVEVT